MRLFRISKSFSVGGLFTRVSDYCFDEQFRDLAYAVTLMISFSSFPFASSHNFIYRHVVDISNYHPDCIFV